MSGPLTTEDSPRIAWETAEVNDSELNVELGGELPKGWGKRFVAVFDRLADGDQRWGPARVSKRALTVRDVREGSEQDLRHQLESALLQANADLGVAGDGGDAAAQSPESERDARMAEAFRGFAGQS